MLDWFLVIWAWLGDILHPIVAFILQHADQFNGAFETAGAAFVFASVIKLYKEKEAKGVNVATPLFFVSWGLWNPIYYVNLGQWYSFFGGLLLMTANLIWIGQIFYYSNKGKT